MSQKTFDQPQDSPVTGFQRVGVVGAGAMGRGIAQIIAQIGIPTRLHDSDGKALEAAQASIHNTWTMMQEKGRLSAAQLEKAHEALSLSNSLEGLADCDLVIEAIVERLDIKQSLLRQLESIVQADTVLASNTSSLSVAAMASCLEHPERVAGYHFFNPVPLMKIVEVVRAAKTSGHVVERLTALAKTVGHRAVVCGDTPGFIVNHAGRGFGPESLRALGDAVAPVQVIDRLLREQVQFEGKGFKLGPFELMDLTAIDVSHPVMESIYHQYYEEPRYRPSVITAQRMAAGLFGRKTGEGFYRYIDTKKQELPWPVLPDVLAEDAPCSSVWIAPMLDTQPPWVLESLQHFIGEAGLACQADDQASTNALIVLCPLGEDATSMAHRLGLDASRCIAIDTLFPFGWKQCSVRSIMGTITSTRKTLAMASKLFSSDGASVALLGDSPGFIAQRVIGMIVSIACDMAQQAVASPKDIDDAVRIGLGYPVGPLSMGDAIGPKRLLAVMDGLYATTQEPRYRPSLWLKRRAQVNVSLLHQSASF